MKAPNPLHTASFSLSVVRHALLPSIPLALKTAYHDGLTKKYPQQFIGELLLNFFQNSGPVFIKLAQILSTRTDLLPKTICEKLEKTISAQKAMPKRKVQKKLKAQYGKFTPFKTFTQKPIGVGSIGQVHRAVLHDGEHVVVKILRPHVAEDIDKNLTTLKELLQLSFSLISKKNSSIQKVLENAFQDLASALRLEVDLRNEASSIEEFNLRFYTSPDVCVPKLYKEYSSSEILVMEELKGTPLSKINAKSNPKIAQRLADQALREILKQIFLDGRFHADPHGGNLLIMEDGRLGLIDLGLTGSFEKRDRENIARALKAFATKDKDELVKGLLGFGVVPENFDEQSFSHSLFKVIEVFKQKNSDSKALEHFVNEVFSVVYAHGILVPMSTVLLIKTLVTIEGVSKNLNPDIDLTRTALPIVLKSLAPQWLRWMPWETLASRIQPQKNSK